MSGSNSGSGGLLSGIVSGTISGIVAGVVIVAIASNPNKTPMFTLEKRVDLARQVL